MGAVQGRINRRRRGGDLDGRKRILCYGDSNTAGFYARGTRFDPYAGHLNVALQEHGLDCEVTHCGLSGLTAEELLAKQGAPAIRDVVGSVGKGLAWLLSESPQDLVLIMLGTNDIGKGTHPEHILQYVSEMHSICHSQGTPTLALAPPTVLAGPPRDSRNYLAQRLDQYADEVPEVFGQADAEALVPRADRALWEPDQLHLAPAGSRQLGFGLAPLVMDTLQNSIGTFRFRPGMLVEFFSEKLQKWVRREVEHVEHGAVIMRGEEDAPILRSQWESKIRPVQADDQEQSPVSAGGGSPGSRPSKAPRPCAVRGCNRSAAGQYATCCRTCGKTGGSDHGPRCEAACAAQQGQGGSPGTSPRTRRSISTQQFKAGQQVDYYSTSNGRWIPTCILRVDPTSRAVELEAKPGSWIEAAEQTQRLRVAHTKSPKSGVDVNSSPYYIGQQLELYSVSKKVWTRCNVTDIDAGSGAVQVDAKPGYWFSKEEQTERFRDLSNPESPSSGPAGPALAFSGFTIGEEYEYFSKSNGKWIKCKVIAIEPNGAIQLDVKPGCSIPLEDQAENIRMPRESFRFYSVVL